MNTTRITSAILAAALTLAASAAPASAQPDERRGGPSAVDRERPDQPERRGFGDRQRFGDRAPELTEQRVQQMMTVIREHAPEYATQLESLRERDPEAFRKLLRKLGPRFEAARGFLERDPEGFAAHMRYKRLSAEIGRTVHRFRSASNDAEKAVLRDRLRELIDQRFALQIEQAQREVVRIEQRLDTLRTEITRRERNRDQLINEQLDAVLAAPHDSDHRFDPRNPSDGDPRNRVEPRNPRDGRDGRSPLHPDRPDRRAHPDRPDRPDDRESRGPRDRRDGPPPPDVPE